MTLFTINPEKLARDFGYTLTDEYNGREVQKGRQTMTVVSAAYFPASAQVDPELLAVASVVGKRGAKDVAHIYRDGSIVI